MRARSTVRARDWDQEVERAPQFAALLLLDHTGTAPGRSAAIAGSSFAWERHSERSLPLAHLRRSARGIDRDGQGVTGTAPSSYRRAPCSLGDPTLCTEVAMPGEPENVGSVVALWRYPVKAMMGEELNAVDLTERGLLGDRVYAIVDPESGKVASAKHPKKWPHLFDCRAAFVEPPRVGDAPPPVRVSLPDGPSMRSDEGGFGEALDTMLGRRGVLQSVPPEEPVLEEYWPDIEGLDLRDAVTDEAMPKGTFFDIGTVHVLTTATIDRLRELYPAGRFEVRRFRPNVVIAPSNGGPGFLENDWVGRTLAIGDAVRLRVTELCPRCVMTTLAQGDLPRDPGILRTAAQHNKAKVGVYADVERSGQVRRGDAVILV
jgi:hypothetical protein